MPSSPARWTSAGGCADPYCSEKPEATWRCGKGPSGDTDLTCRTLGMTSVGGVQRCLLGAQRGVRHDPQRVLDDRQEAVRIPEQVVGLTLGDRTGRPGFGSCPLGGAGSKEGGPLLKLGSDLSQQYPGTALTTTRRRRMSPGRQQRGR